MKVSGEVGTRLMALDTATLYYRAFHALPTTLTAPDGMPVNAVRGTLDMIAALIQEFEPDVVVAAWDEQWRPAWRTALVPQYKAHRVAAGTYNAEDVPAELAPQIPLVRQALEHLGIAVMGVADQEADDVLGALVRSWAGESFVVSGDRDLFQLADDERQSAVVYIGAGIKKLEVVTDAWLADKYQLAPGQYRDFAALRGDASDGLPGVPGIGDKTAAKLLGQFESIEGILSAAEQSHRALTPRTCANLIAAKDYLRAVRSVIAVGEKVDLVAPSQQAPCDVQAFEDLAERWGLGKPAERLLSTMLGLADRG